MLFFMLNTVENLKYVNMRWFVGGAVTHTCRVEDQHCHILIQHICWISLIGNHPHSLMKFWYSTTLQVHKTPSHARVERSEFYSCNQNTLNNVEYLHTVILILYLYPNKI